MFHTNTRFEAEVQEKKAFMNCSQGPLTGRKDSFTLSVLYHNFLALNSCDLPTELEWSIFSPWCRFSRKHQDEKRNLHSVFTLTKDYLYATVRQIWFLLPHWNIFDCCGQWSMKNFAFKSKRRQKQINLLAVWVLPFFGSLLCSIYTAAGFPA